MPTKETTVIILPTKIVSKRTPYPLIQGEGLVSAGTYTDHYDTFSGGHAGRGGTPLSGKERSFRATKKNKPVVIKTDYYVELQKQYPTPPKYLQDRMAATLFREMLGKLDIQKDNINLAIEVEYTNAYEDKDEAFKAAQYGNEAVTAGAFTLQIFLRRHPSVFDDIRDAQKNPKKYLSTNCPDSIINANENGYLTKTMIESLPSNWQEELASNNKLTVEQLAIRLDSCMTPEQKAEELADIQLRVKDGTMILAESNPNKPIAKFDDNSHNILNNFTHRDYFEGNKTEITALFTNLQQLAANQAAPKSMSKEDFETFDKNAKNYKTDKENQKQKDAAAEKFKLQNEADAKKGKIHSQKIFTMEDIINQLILLDNNADKINYLRYVADRILDTKNPAAFHYKEKDYLEKEIPGLNGVKYKDYFDANKDILNKIQGVLTQKEDVRRTPGDDAKKVDGYFFDNDKNKPASKVDVNNNAELVLKTINNFPNTIIDAIDQANLRIQTENQVNFEKEKLANPSAVPVVHTPIPVPANDNDIRNNLRTAVTNKAAAATPQSSSSKPVNPAAAGAANNTSQISLANQKFAAFTNENGIEKFLQDNKDKFNIKEVANRINASDSFEVTFKDTTTAKINSNNTVNFPPGKEEFAIEAFKALVNKPKPEVILFAKTDAELKTLVETAEKQGLEVKGSTTDQNLYKSWQANTEVPTRHDAPTPQPQQPQHASPSHT